MEYYVKINVYVPAATFEEFINNPCYVATDVAYGIKGMTPTHKELIAELMLKALREKLEGKQWN